MQKKRVTKIVQSLDTLNTKDIYSMLLFTLYNMHDIPEYSTLSELCYILDKDNLMKFFSYYGGMTIKVPTLKQMRLLLKALTLYQYVNLEEESFEDALSVISGTGDFTEAELKATYSTLLEVLSKYEFGDNDVKK